MDTKNNEEYRIDNKLLTPDEDPMPWSEMI